MALGDALDWDDLRLFLTVAEEGSFSRASKVLGTTQPTVSRRLAALEARIGGPLFERTAAGADVTARGRAVLSLVETMSRAAASVEQIAKSGARELAGRVAVACGEMVGRLIASRATTLLAAAPDIELEVLTSLRDVNLERGEADIALRNRRPRSANLYARRVAQSRFAIYGAKAYVHDHPEANDERRFTACDWIGYDSPRAKAPSARWLAERIAGAPRLRFSSNSLILEAAAHRGGLAVLPMHAGETDARLVRVSAPLDDLAFDGYVVTHARSRSLPRVRFVAEALADMLRTATEG
jgi:DNA-binding transcriptional LysR family regulator